MMPAYELRAIWRAEHFHPNRKPDLNPNPNPRQIAQLHKMRVMYVYE